MYEIIGANAKTDKRFSIWCESYSKMQNKIIALRHSKTAYYIGVWKY